MNANVRRRAGRHFLQIPGPSPVPDRIMRAMAMPVIDHRGPEFQKLGQRVLARLKTSSRPRAMSSSIRPPAPAPGKRRLSIPFARRQRADVRDRPLRHAVEEHGRQARARVGIHRLAIGAAASMPAADRGAPARGPAHAIKAVCVVHNETSTGVTSHIADVRAGDRRAPAIPPC